MILRLFRIFNYYLLFTIFNQKKLYFNLKNYILANKIQSNNVEINGIRARNNPLQKIFVVIKIKKFCVNKHFMFRKQIVKIFNKCLSN